MEYSFFEWTPDISVGDKKLDEQHKLLLKEVNVLLSSLISNMSDDVVAQAISFLDNYIETHLKYEEEYMEQHEYPEIEVHKAMHRDFIKHYGEFKQRFENKAVPRSELISEVESYIGNWWLQHIGVADKKYAVFIERKK